MTDFINKRGRLTAAVFVTMLLGGVAVAVLVKPAYSHKGKLYTDRFVSTNFPVFKPDE